MARAISPFTVERATDHRRHRGCQLTLVGVAASLRCCAVSYHYQQIEPGYSPGKLSASQTFHTPRRRAEDLCEIGERLKRCGLHIRNTILTSGTLV